MRTLRQNPTLIDCYEIASAATSRGVLRQLACLKKKDGVKFDRRIDYRA